MDGQGGYEVHSMPVEDAGNILTMGSFGRLKSYVYRDTKTWFRKYGLNKEIYSTDIGQYHPCSAVFTDANSLLLIEADTIKRALQLTTIDSSGHTKGKHLQVSVSPELCRYLALGAITLLADNQYIVISKYAPVSLKIDPHSGAATVYTLPAEKKEKKSTLDRVFQQPPLLQNFLAGYYFKENLIFELSNRPDQATGLKLPFYISFLDFYNLDFDYQYSIALKDVDAKNLSDVAIYEGQYYLLLGRHFINGYLDNAPATPENITSDRQ